MAGPATDSTTTAGEAATTPMSTQNETAHAAVEVPGLSTDHSRAVADGAHTHGVVPQASRAERRSSFDVADFAVPSGQEEEWRFSPVRRLAPLFDVVQAGTGARTTVVEAPEVTVEIVGKDDARVGLAGRPGDRAAAAGWAGVHQATVVTIPAQAVASAATSVRVEGTVAAGHAPQADAAHLVIHALPLSEAVVVVDHVGSVLLNETVEVVAEDGAHLTVVSIQDWEAGSVHAASHRIRIGRDATVKHIVVTLGGDVVRITPDAEFTGPGGSLEALGLYFADAGQHQEHRLFVDHAVPSCKSRVTYKGALQGAGAHTVWVGDVLIRANAEGTDTYELNRNLVLSDGARADSVPNLEIETGVIEGAGHASATGRFDDEQLFYLRSRGVPESEARRLVVRGFFAELIQQIGVHAIEERLLTAIEEELETSMATSLGAAGSSSRQVDVPSGVGA